MCPHTWGSHGVNDFLVVHNEQVPLLPPHATSIHSAEPSGIRVPQIRRAFVSSIAVGESKARL